MDIAKTDLVSSQDLWFLYWMATEDPCIMTDFDTRKLGESDRGVSYKASKYGAQLLSG